MKVWIYFEFTAFFSKLSSKRNSKQLYYTLVIQAINFIYERYQ